jgi:hypothetical protein
MRDPSFTRWGHAPHPIQALLSIITTTTIRTCTPSSTGWQERLLVYLISPASPLGATVVPVQTTQSCCPHIGAPMALHPPQATIVYPPPPSFIRPTPPLHQVGLMGQQQASSGVQDQTLLVCRAS